MPADEEGSELELREYLAVVRRRRRVIILVVVLVVTATAVISLLRTPIYAGTAEVLLQPKSTESLFDSNTGQRVDPDRALQTEIRILQSQPVREAVRTQLGDVPKVSASPAGKTDVIEVSAESPVPQRAAQITNAYATAYIDFRRKQAVDELLAAGKEIQAKVSDLQRQIDAATGSQRENLVQLQGLFRQKLDQLQVDGALKSGGAQLVTSAPVPTSPVRPNPARNSLLALVVGLFLGVGIAFVVDYLDDSVKGKDDLARLALGVPVLGMIPLQSAWKPKDGPFVVSLSEPKSGAAEAYRTLRTSIQFLGLERPMRTLQVVSPNASEGKTTTLANLGVALARAGERVVIVCCDLRRPRIHDFFGLSNEVGFTSVLLGKVGVSGALQEVPDQPRLSVLASGPLPPNPSELLTSRRTVEVLTSLQTEADIVLIDSPPVLPVTDALVLSGRVDATLLVCVAGATTRGELSRTVELLRQVDAPLVGTVLNGVSSEGTYGYAYGYYEQDQRSEGGDAVKR